MPSIPSVEPQESNAAAPTKAAAASTAAASTAAAAEAAAGEAALREAVAVGNSEDLSNADLLLQLTADRLWLLRQIDGGRWPDLRLDLAALERELGQMLDLASERLTNG